MKTNPNDLLLSAPVSSTKIRKVTKIERDTEIVFGRIVIVITNFVSLFIMKY